MNTRLLDDDIQVFLKDNLSSNSSEFILKGSPFPDVTIQDLAQQLIGLKKSKTKLPRWFSTKDILFPPKLNLEQTSSETTAAYKANLIDGNSIIDVTGGFGIDCVYFSEKIEAVTHVELNPELSKLAAHNALRLNAQNIKFISGDGIKHINTSEKKYDWLYCDPSRRDGHGGKVFKLSDCLPNVPKHLDLFFTKAKQVLLKTAPLLDITAGLSELRNVRQIHIIAVNNDVKELLWVLDTEANLRESEPKITTVNIKAEATEEFSATMNTIAAECSYANPESFLYEPNAAIMKSGLFNALSETLKLPKLNQHSHLYTSKQLVGFPGRRFKILEVLPFKKKLLSKRFKDTRANITTRNFPLSVAQLRSQLKVDDGGDTYLFFTTVNTSEKICIITEKT